MHGVGVGEAVRHERVTCLVVRHPLFLIGIHDSLFFLKPCGDPLNAFVEVLHLNGVTPAASREQCRFVNEIGKFCPAKAWADRCYLLDFHVWIELNTFNMNFEYCCATHHIGAVNEHMSVESSRTHQGLVKSFGAVRRSHHNDSAVGAETIHFDEESIECLFTFVVSPNRIAAASFSQRVEFVNENNARRFGFCLLKHIPDACGTDANKHLNEITS